MMIRLLAVAAFAKWLLPCPSLADEPARDYSGITTPLLLAVRTGDDDDVMT